MSINRAATIREAYAEASSFLQRSGVREPESNARLLLEHLLGESRSGLLMRWPEPFPREREADWQRLLKRKASGEPVQYIVGEQEFYGLPFAVTPAVLIPRPETELLVEQIVQLGRQLWPESSAKQPSAADIGTGSGAIAVTLAVQCPAWKIKASDIFSEALEVARGNAESNGVAQRVQFVEGDLLGPWIEHGWGMDVLVSNPPYIPQGDEPTLQPEVRLFEPHTALFGGTDGLEPYRRLTAQFQELVTLPRLVGFELGQGQAAAVRSLLEQAGDWDDVLTIPDLAGIERHVVAFRNK